MWGLLISTVVTSAADSLNPVAITQQFVLQGMVRKPKHIWYFIIPTGVTNLIGGLLADYGLVAFVGGLFRELAERHGRIFSIAGLILGIGFLVGVGFLAQSGKIKALQRQLHSLKSGEAPGHENEESEAARKIKSVSPLALVALGIGATLSELATALPYFAFLAILLNCQLTPLQVVLILIVYNTIYTSPLMLLYFLYTKAQKKFDRLYRMIKARIVKWADVLAPTLMGIIGVVLLYHSLSALLQ